MDPPSRTTHTFLDNAHLDSAWMADDTFGGSLSDPPAFIQFCVYFKLFSTALGLVNTVIIFHPRMLARLCRLWVRYAQITNIFIP